MMIVPITPTAQSILNAWICKQVELLSQQLSTLGITTYPDATSRQRAYVIEFNGETIYGSPEKAYATLCFLQALQERERRELADSQACSPLAI